MVGGWGGLRGSGSDRLVAGIRLLAVVRAPRSHCHTFDACGGGLIGSRSADLTKPSEHLRWEREAHYVAPRTVGVIRRRCLSFVAAHRSRTVYRASAADRRDGFS